MSSRLRVVPLSILAALAVLPATPAAASDGPVVVLGAAFSLTGAGAPYGPSQERGAQLAVDEINLSGGLPGNTEVLLSVRDDHSVPADAAALFDAMAPTATALLGPTLSGSALVADKVAQQRGVPVMGISNTVDGLTDIGPFVFRNSLAESVVQPQTVKVAKKRFKLKRVAIVSALDTYAAAGRAVFRKALKKNGIRLTADRTFTTGKPATLRAALKKIAATKPDALVISALQGDVVQAMVGARTFKALKKVHFIGGNAFNAPGLYAQTKGAADGAVSGTAWVASGDTPGNAAFVAAYKAKYGTAPDQFAAQAYAGVRLITDTIVRLGSPTNAYYVSPDMLRAGLSEIRDTPSILGRFSFDSKRDPVYEPTVVVDRKGRQVPIG